MIAVEVTQAARPAVQQQLTVGSKLDWELPDLVEPWYISVREAAPNLKAMHGAIGKFLNQMSQLGISKYSPGDPQIGADTHARIKSFGIRAIAAMPTLDTNIVIVSVAPSGGVFHANSAATVVADHANRLDNALKLGKAESDPHEEMSFNCAVLTDYGDASAAMTEPQLPDAMPDLPSEIDVVWLATGFDPPTIWRYDRSGWSITR